MYICSLNDITMETVINRRTAMFRFRADLLDRLKQMAAKDNRSLNNFVETILMDVAYNTPNAETHEAIMEARRGQNLTDVDMADYESFVNSLGLK